MATPNFQVAALVAPPLYPNSVVWSEENLLAIANSHLITILNPADINGPRGLIPISGSPPFDIGKVRREDLMKECLSSICLSRDARCYVRSIAWSQQGMALNGGCLLAVCTTDNRVKVYRAPYCDFRSEWVEIIDISEMLYKYFLDVKFGETGFQISLELNALEEGASRMNSDEEEASRHRNVRRKSKNSADLVPMENDESYDAAKDSGDGFVDEMTSNNLRKIVKVHTTSTFVACSTFAVGTSVEVLKTNGLLRFWVLGKIKHLDGKRALVHFSGISEDEMQEEWVSLGSGMGTKKELITDENITLRQEHLLPKIRPSVKFQNLPKDIAMASFGDVSIEVAMRGQLLEAWIRNRWVEGSFAGFNGSEILVNFPGEYGCIALEPNTVRLAPTWNEEQKSWIMSVATINLARKKTSRNGLVETKNLNIPERRCHQHASRRKTYEKTTQKPYVDNLKSTISANQYALRSRLLTSLIVAWSPTIKYSSEDEICDGPYGKFALLAVGAKSGKVSIWSIFEPPYYTIEPCQFSNEVRFIGLLQAHKSWVTAATWALCTVTSSSVAETNSAGKRLILVTGSCDGSVSIWQQDPDGLHKHSDIHSSPLSHMKEVLEADLMPVSSLALAVPSQSPDKVLVAVGKSSGLITVWICYMSENKYFKAGDIQAHDQVVTGLAWAFDSRCFYSCSQDNAIRAWIVQENSLVSVSFPSSTSGLCSDTLRSNIDLPSYAFDGCYGLALSQGNLILVAVRSVDTDVVDPMYQSRSHKAVAEFFWVGGQQLKMSVGRLTDNISDLYDSISEKDAFFWQTNVLWSLKCFEDVRRPLVLWDVVKALVHLKFVSVPIFETILFRWFSSFFPESHHGHALEMCLIRLQSLLTKLSCRQLHMLVIVCRRVVVSFKEAEPKQSCRYEVGSEETNKQEISKCWAALLEKSEFELRERLVFFTFCVILHRTTDEHNADHPMKQVWVPAGAPQMQEWIKLDKVSESLKHLSEQLSRLGCGRIASVSEFVCSEQCMFCNEAVRFESPDVASCEAEHTSVNQNHKLQRCSVSMQVCSATPLWFCVCCRRWALKQPPAEFFFMSSSQDIKFSHDNSIICGESKPLCPFCGIILQRFLPDFLPSASLV